MKKKFLKISLLLLFLLLTSCANTSIDKTGTKTADVSSSGEVTRVTSSQQTKVSVIGDYYPFKENTSYSYEGQGNEYASYTVFTDYINENRVQIRSNNGGTETVKVLENKDGQLSIISSKGECYYREDFTNNTGENEEILLKEPLVKGTEWTVLDNKKRFISSIDSDVVTPAGKFKAIEVTTEGEGNKTVDYYAMDVGLVKTVYSAKDMEVSSTLSKIEEKVALTQTIRFYYPDVIADLIYFVDKQLVFNTNDITRTTIEEAFKEVPKDTLGKLLGPNVKINSLYLNKDNMVYIDFSKELVSEMNAGSGYESMILQSITNTIGTYYGVAKVYITVEGQPYVSGHIMLEKGKAFEVKLENSVELK